MLCVPLRPPRLFFLLYIMYNIMYSSKSDRMEDLLALHYLGTDPAR